MHLFKTLKNCIALLINYNGQKRINITKTILINFKTQSLKNALKFPIIIRGKCNLIGLRQNSIVLKEIRPAIVRIGYNEGFSNEKCGVRIRIKGCITFEGSAFICVDSTIESYGNLRIGDNVFIGNSVKIFCHHNICIGKNASITVESQMFDTNFHYIRNISDGTVNRRWNDVKIGHSSWIGNRTTIMPGTNLPPFSIVASNSLLNKDYTNFGEACFFAGSPAVLKKTGVTRLFDYKLEKNIDEIFRFKEIRNYNTNIIGLETKEEFWYQN